MANYRDLLLSFLKTKIVFFLSSLFAIGLSTLIFVNPCEALYIDNSVHLHSQAEKSEVLNTKTHSQPPQLSNTSQDYKESGWNTFSLVNLIEIIATSVVTGFGVKLLFHDKLLKSSTTIKELRARVENLEEITTKIE